MSSRGPTTLIDVLRQRAQQTPDEVAFLWLDEGESRPRLTWSELERQARAVASALCAQVAPGDRACLLYAPGLEFLSAFFGCLYAGVVAVPVPVPRPQQAGRRLQGVVIDSDPAVVLTSSKTLPRVQRLAEVQHLPKLVTNELELDAGGGRPLPEAGGDQAAYLQYTSGSTSNPRGVVVTHDNLMANLAMLQAAWQHPAGQYLVSWLPLFHDMGLVTMPLMAVYVGAPCALMAPAGFLARPVRWLQAISDFRAHTSGAPNFAYDLCVRKVGPAERAELDLSGWKVAFNGAEPVRPQTLERFAAAFAPCGLTAAALQPVYGLAEATVFVSGNPTQSPTVTLDVDAAALGHNRVEPGTHRLASCGRAWLQERIQVVRADTLEACPAGEVGEVWVSGPHVSPGYWNKPGDPAFGARVVGGDGTPCLRTGDLGFLDEEGQLFITGRLKDVIVIRGVNHYPQDIELTVERSHAALSPGGGAAFSVDRDGEERLVVVHEVASQQIVVGEVLAAVRQAVSEAHDLEVHAIVLIRKGTLPRTSSGKVQRQQCRADFLANSLQEVSTWMLRRRKRARPARLEGAPSSAQDLIAWVRRHDQELLAARRQAPRGLSAEVMQALAASGLLGMVAPVELGGLGLGLRDMLQVVEQVAAIDPGLALAVGLHNVLGVRPVVAFGTPQARRTCLPPLLSGQMLGGFAMESVGRPMAGQAGARAEAQGGWRLFGRKWLVAPSTQAGLVNLLLRCQSPQGEDQGYTAFVVPEGLRVPASGGVPAREPLTLDGHAVQPWQVLGQPGSGKGIAREARQWAYLVGAAVCLGGMKRCVQLQHLNLEAATDEDPLAALSLADMVAAVSALEALVANACQTVERGGAPSDDLPSASIIAASELFGRVAAATQPGSRVARPEEEPVLRDGRNLAWPFDLDSLRRRLGSRYADAATPSLLPGPLHARMRQALAQVQEAGAASRIFPDRQASRHWVHLRCGALLAVSLMVAALEQASLEPAARRQASRWVSVQFDRQLDAALREATDDGGQEPLVQAELARYEQAVGRISPVVHAPSRWTLPSRTPEQIQAWLSNWLSQRKGMGVVPSRPLAEYGLDSLQAVELAGDLSNWLHQPLEPTVVWSFPTVEELVSHLAGQNPTWSATPRLETREEPIAIIGIGCRFPGGVIDPDSFWRLLLEGRDAVTEVPPERWDIDAYYDPTPGTPGRTVSRWGGFLQDVDLFDASFFGISPREAASMDPQQRLLLEVSWEALEHAGQPPDQMVGSPTGVFVGICSNDYAALARPGGDNWSGTGTAFSVAAGRVSYVLGLQGPSIIVDTASSSSLVAVHLACQSLRTKECTMALAGGVNLILTPDNTLYMSQLGTMASDGRCKSFDAAANGYVRSEGCGLVVLKRLADAQADGDRVLAVIRGSAVNQDGRSNGLTAPSGPAQAVLIRRALHRAGVKPAEVSYLEAHGTGTPLGDQVEVRALGRVLREGRSPHRPLIVGSVKSMIGHCEAAAGVAGLIKTVLALQHEMIPAQLHLHTPHPSIPWDELQVQPPARHLPWPGGPQKRVAGVSSFGLSGTNAHVVLEEAPRPVPVETVPGRTLLIPLSARTPQALEELAETWRTFLPEHAQELVSVAYTASRRRAHHGVRMALVGDSASAMVDGLAAFCDGRSAPGVLSGTATAQRIVFVFSGQGSHWLGMGRGLMSTETVFKAALEACDAAIQREAGWSVLEALLADEATSRLDRTDVFQPVLFSVQVALAALWHSWGVSPDAVVGHSLGEIAAAHVCGALGLADAVRIVCNRSRLMRTVSGHGAMAVVELSPEEVRQRLGDVADRLCVAVVNAPRSTVISGEPAAVEAFLSALEAESIFFRRIEKVDGVACHSPQMEPLLPALAEALVDLRPQASLVPIYSTVTADVINGAELDREYWLRNIREPVLFADTMQVLLEAGYTTFVEISPHPVLLPAIQPVLRAEAQVVASLRRGQPEQASMLESLGRLYVTGCSVGWHHLYPTGTLVGLPPYPWQRERHWVQPAAPSEAPAAAAPAFCPIESDPQLDVMVEWQALAPGAPDPRRLEQGWLVVGADGEPLVQALEAAGARALWAPEPRAPGTATNVVYVTSPAPEAPAFSNATRYCHDILELVRGLKANGTRDARLWLVTRQGQAVGDGPVDPAQAAVWGLVRTLTAEYLEMRFFCVDVALDEAVWPGAVVNELLSVSGNDGVALRPGGRRAARLRRAGRTRVQQLQVHPGARYLVAGDAPGMMTAAVRWLSAQGATHLVLVGPEDVTTPLRALLPADATVTCRASVAEALSDHQPYRGVLYAPITPRQGKAAGLAMDDIKRVMRAQAGDAWRLHEAFSQRASVDFFVLCSSVSSVLAMAEEGLGAAAGAFLDALAALRRSQGLAGVSINWPPYEQDGHDARAANLATRGLSTLTTVQVDAALGRMGRSQVPQVAVLPLNLRHWLEYHPYAAASSMLSGLRVLAKGDAAPVASIRQRLLAAGAERARQLEQFVRDTVAQVLRVDAARVGRDVPFKALGLESLMGLELRNRLETALGLKLPATLIWTYSALGSLSEQLDRMLDGDKAPPRPGVVASTPPPRAEAPVAAPLPADETAAQEHLSGLSDAEKEKLLEAALAQLEGSLNDL